ncbi:Pkinase-domain-containing protein [Thozetella sp. PMI_491]|nr:Pkinase-domain-containing protein [Thozetella sp. PMI_491]
MQGGLLSGSRHYDADDSASVRSKPAKRGPRDPNNPVPSMNPNLGAHQENRPSSTAPAAYDAVPAGQHRLRSQDTREVAAEKRVSQFSNVSSTASTTRQLKTHIGPWQLGKTLRKGSSARVRLARHRVTHQLAAIKIVTKESAKITQAGSLANLDSIYENQKLSVLEGHRRMPVTIEREVAILKLIEHPNIMKLYDIWENRSEIYLVTEFVEKGDMFEFINWQGRMREEEAMYYFRQIMRAMEYIHSFNICHRDLKPENILLKADGTVKIADFGMAALRQGPNRPLTTACGSPHYAAPELLRNQGYMGPEVDLWSMGVILFAMLAGRLPFDEANLHVMLAKSKNADYEMSEHLSLEARDLIRRILVANPKRRVNMRQMWESPLLRKYDYLDQFIFDGKVLPVREDIDIEAIPLEAIDPQILRQLKALWHTASDTELQAKLMEDQRNEHKTFYWLLFKYREARLENYNNDVPISKSDYHHLKPPNWGKRVSTCQFTHPRRKGQHQRVVSRFTVISNVAEAPAPSEFGTVKSYDPYNASKVLQPLDSQVSHAHIVIHRPSCPEPGSRKSSTKVAHSFKSYHSASGSGTQRQRRNSVRTYTSDSTGTGRLRSPHSSMGSIQSSRRGTPRVRVSSRHRRGVDFSGVRNRATKDGSRRSSERPCGERPSSAAGRQGVAREGQPLSRQFQPREKPKDRRNKIGGSTVSAYEVAKPRGDSVIWNEELKALSHTIAKDCDEAFQSSIISSPFSLTLGSPSTRACPDTPLSSEPANKRSSRPWDDRPLPPVPRTCPQSPPLTGDSNSSVQFAANSNFLSAQQVRGSLGTPTPVSSDRRIVSAPSYHQASPDPRALPSIYENTSEICTARAVSLPVEVVGKPSTPKGDKTLAYHGRGENTIRIVQSPSATRGNNSLKPPRPLSIHKHHMRGVSETFPTPAPRAVSRLSLQQDTKAGNACLKQDGVRVSQNGDATVATKRKVSSWFRRSSKESKDEVTAAAEASFTTVTGSASQSQPQTVETSAKPGDDKASATSRMTSQQTHSDSPAPPPAKKKPFGLSFWKPSKNEPRMSLAGPEYRDTPSPDPKSKLEKARGKLKSDQGLPSHPSRGRSLWRDDGEVDPSRTNRKIEVQQNWLARLFRVKPATRHLCFAISKRRSRQEVAILLREWRRYGIRDIEVDKERNIVFARVGSKNYLNMKEVSFAAEIMTVIEHGRRSHLSIVRFTQEKGAASSFNKVIDTMEAVFHNRALLVVDKRKSKMMIKTLNA